MASRRFGLVVLLYVALVAGSAWLGPGIAERQREARVRSANAVAFGSGTDAL